MARPAQERSGGANTRARRLAGALRALVAERDVVPYLALLAVTTLLLVFVEIAEDVVEDDWASVDESVLLLLRESGSLSDPLGPPWLEEIFRDITVLGGGVVVTLVTLVTLGHLLLLGEWRTGLVFLGAVCAGGLASALLKAFFQRPRPSVVDAVIATSGLSFPSGHSLISAVIYPVLGALLIRVVERRRMKLYVVAVSLALTFVIGVSRVYLGVHYPSDVLAGWTLGLSLSLLSWTVLRRLQQHGVVEPPPPPSR